MAGCDAQRNRHEEERRGRQDTQNKNRCRDTERACDRMEVQGTDGWREERVQKKSVIQLLLLFLLNI